MDRSSADRHREPMRATERLQDTPSSPPVRRLPDLDRSEDERESDIISHTGLTNPSTRVPSAVTSGPSQQQQELVDLIDASDKEVIKDVLLHLCTVSPALSGALTRGLTPYARSRQSDSQHDGREMNETRAAHGPLIQSSQPKVSSPEHSTRSSDHRSHKVKNEDTIPTPFKRSEEPMSGHVMRDMHEQHRFPRSLISSSLTESTKNMEKCINCGKMFDKDSTTADCFYHPGSKRKARTITGLLQVQYDCCQGDVYDPPCEIRKHVAETKSDFDTLRRPFLYRELERQEPRTFKRLG